MSLVDPWEKAADCERALRITVDPVHREALSNIREFWIALAQESRFLSDEAVATQIETIGRLQARLDRGGSLIIQAPDCAWAAYAAKFRREMQRLRLWSHSTYHWCCN